MNPPIADLENITIDSIHFIKTLLTIEKLPDGVKCPLGTPLCLNFSQIGMVGIEPTTPASRKQCATKLRYIP
jgi:hypothetical protein